jgi:hypothetical protein
VGSSKRFVKDPNAVLDFSIDWAAWLGSDTIDTDPADCAWTVPAGITSTLQTNTTTAATIWLSGGTLGAEYDLVNRIVTAGGRTEDCTITIVMESK